MLEVTGAEGIRLNTFETTFETYTAHISKKDV